MQGWCAFATRVEAGQRLGTYVPGPWRGVLHTTESRNYRPSATDYYGHQNWPHFTVARVGGKADVFQHIPITRPARALRNASGGVETNRLHAVQIEIAWKAAEIEQLPEDLRWALRHLMRWIEAQTGMPRQSAKFLSYPASYGGSGVRLDKAQWRAFTGWCGHQHVPENDHGDPGDIDIDFLLGAERDEEEGDMYLLVKPEDDNKLYAHHPAHSFHIGSSAEQRRLVEAGLLRAGREIVLPRSLFDKLVRVQR